MFKLVPFKRNTDIEMKNRNLFDIDNIFENFFNDTVFPTFYSNSGQMRVDIKETDKEYVLEAELPGVRKDEVDIYLDDDTLTISVQKNEKTDEKKDNYIRKERRSSSMTRSFAVTNIMNNRVSARFEDGILSITLPKKEQSKPNGKKIDIE